MRRAGIRGSDHRVARVGGPDRVQERRQGPVVSRWLRERRPLSKRAVRSMLVVMPRVGSDDVLEMAAAEDQEVVEAFATEAADPALGVRSRPGRPHRRLDYPDAFGAEDLIEVAGELAVAVTDKEPRLDALGFELHEQVARLLGHPPALGVRRDPSQVNAAGRQLDEEQHVEPLQEERVDGEEVALEDARRLLAQEIRPARLKALRCRLDPRLPENRPDRARRDLDAEADQFALDPPVPQAGFSRASRTTSSRTAAGVAGRPGRLCGYVQRRATSSRCQRSRVPGVTNNDLLHVCRGSTRQNAASNALSLCVSCGRATWRSST